MSKPNAISWIDAGLMPVDKEPCARDPQLHAFMFNCRKSESITIKHAYSESADFTERYVVDFDINGSSNLTDIVQVSGIEGTVSRITVTS